MSSILLILLKLYYIVLYYIILYYIILSVVSYGVEAWTLTKKEEQALIIFERKIFRTIYDPKYENEEWKSWTN